MEKAATESNESSTPKKGGFRHNSLGVMVGEKPAKAAEVISKAWLKEKTSDKAAKKLGVSAATFWRYVNKLEAAGFRAKPRDEHGETPHRGGSLR